MSFGELWYVGTHRWNTKENTINAQEKHRRSLPAFYLKKGPQTRENGRAKQDAPME